MSTYPPRRDGVINAARQIAPQVDQLNLVLNEYDALLPELTGVENINQILPKYDTKDTGKFYPDIKNADYVMTLDDDIGYPDDLVSRTLQLFAPYGSGYIGGYHASLYMSRWDYLKKLRLRRVVSYDRARIADHRRVYSFHTGLDTPMVVDQIASGAAIMCASDVPPFDYMIDSQRFVDVRLARWCYERAIKPVALPKPSGWLAKIEYEETIYQGFTQTNPPDVTNEIHSFAFKVSGRGAAPLTPAERI